MKHEPKVTARYRIPIGLALGSLEEGERETTTDNAKVYVIEDGEDVHLAVFQFRDVSLMVELGDLMQISTMSDTWKRVEECARG